MDFYSHWVNVSSSIMYFVTIWFTNDHHAILNHAFFLFCRAAIASAGGKQMELSSKSLQYLIREHMIENSPNREEMKDLNSDTFSSSEKLHLRWNSQKGRVFIDGSHLMHNLELGDEVLINSDAPPLALFTRDDWKIMVLQFTAKVVYVRGVCCKTLI